MNFFNESKVAVLGATGYIGRSLFFTLTEQGVPVTPVSRDIKKAAKTYEEYGIIPKSQIIDYNTFLKSDFDVVINATGIGSPKKISFDPVTVFRVTENMDELIFTYVEKYPEVQVFNISSGSVFGLTSGQMVNNDILATFSPNNFGTGDFYSMAKLTSEAKHRARPDLNILDLRVFSFFSQFVDCSDNFLMSEITYCLEQDRELETSPDNIVRDFSNATLLIETMDFLYRRGKENGVYDIVSKQPVNKFELLNQLSIDKGLRYRVTDDNKVSVTGIKNTYCSDGQKLLSLGYKPSMTSYEIILSELSER